MNLFHPDALMLAFWSPSPTEMMVVAMVALLLYGGKLPEVARSWGKSFAEFRRGLTGFQNELNEVIYSEPQQLPYHDEPEYETRDDSRIVDGYEDDGSFQGDETVDYRPDEFSPGEPPEEQSTSDESSQEVSESDQTVSDATADTIVVEPSDKKESEPS